MAITVTMSDGSKFSATGAAGPVESKEAINASQSTRTRLDIAKDLDAKERDHSLAQEHVAELESDIKSLKVELRDFGVKKRPKKNGEPT